MHIVWDLSDRCLTDLLDFSPQVKLWQERMWAFKALIRWRKGLACNQTNVLRTAGRRLKREFPNPREMSIEEMEAGYQYCRGRKQMLKSTAPELRRKYMRNKVLEAEAAKDSDEALYEALMPAFEKVMTKGEKKKRDKELKKKKKAAAALANSGGDANEAGPGGSS